MQAASTAGEVTYRIGVASRLSGVATHTLRKWEERYGVVTPRRSSSGERTYSEDQVHYLARLKALVDAGMDISEVVELDAEGLESAETSLLTVQSPAQAENPRPRVGAVGPHLAQYFRQHADRLQKLDVDWVLPSADEMEGGPGTTADLLIIEQETVSGDCARDVARLLASTGARAGVVLYQFAPRWALHALSELPVSVARMPVEPTDLQRLALGTWYDLTAWPTIVLGPQDESRNAPPRFSHDDLIRISSMSTSMRCECPHHIADLLLSVASFEDYSAQCEVEQPQDADEHRYLRATAASARMLFEEALLRIARAEGIAIADRHAADPTTAD